MKNLSKNFFALLCLVSTFLGGSKVSAQQSLTTITGWNAYVHLPSTYATSGRTYPTIIFFPGLGEVGTTASKVIQYGPGAYIAQGWNGNVTANGSTVEFIVISLQTATSFPNEYLINQAIQSIKAQYRVDNTKLYLTGLSHGGWCSSTFVSGDAYGGPYTYASQIAAVVTVEGMRPDDNSPYPNLFDNFANTGGRYLGFEQSLDNRDTKTVADRMNLTRANSGIYVQTSFGGGGHCCWEQFYGGGGVTPVNFMLDGVSQNIYVWMAKQSLGGTPPPPVNILPVSNAGADKMITLPVSSVTLNGSGTDADGTIASYAWTKISGPAATISSPSAATTSVTGLVQGVYVFQLMVTDNSGATNTDQVQVTVNAAVVTNQLPVANAGVDITTTLPISNATLTGSGTDPDGSIISYQWSLYYGPNTAPILNANSASATISGLLQGIYQVDLTVTDNSGATSTDRMQIFVNAAVANIPPTANAGADLSITLPVNSISVTGSGADTDGTISAYLWTKVSGPVAGNMSNTTSATMALSGLVQGVYVYQLQVTDNSGAINTDQVQVTVNAAIVTNQPPVANAGVDITTTLPVSNATLIGSGTDPDGSIISYQWSLFYGPNTASISNANAATATISGLVQGTYQVDLTVTDNSGASSTDRMQVIVNPAVINIAPTANAGADLSITLPVNSLSVSGSGADPDGSISAYLWTKISGPVSGNMANSTSATMALSGLVQGTYVYQLKVTDNNGAIATDNMQVTVNPVTIITGVPPVVSAGPDISIAGATYASLNGTGYDPDGYMIAWQWRKLSGPASEPINNAAAANAGAGGLVTGTYVFELQGTDNTNISTRDTMQVFVNTSTTPPPPNQLPVANAGSNITITLPVNTATLSGSGTDADGTITSYAWTKISGPAMSFANASAATTGISGLVQGVYIFQLTVTDNSGGTATSQMQVTVNAAIASNQLPVANAGTNITITLPVNTATLNGSGTDADGTITSYAWTKISGPAMSFANASAATTGISGLVQGVYILQLTVTDNSGGTASAQVQVTVNAATIITINKSVKVNLYDGRTPYNNPQWNNWANRNNITSSSFLYSDGTASTINANLNSQDRLADNGTNYSMSSTVVPGEVLRFNSAQTSNRTLTISGLNPANVYSMEFYASRANSGNKTVYSIGNLNDTINTDNNVNDFAKFINISPDNTGKVIVTLSRIGTWEYIAGFMVTEGSVAGRAAAVAPSQPVIMEAALSATDSPDPAGIMAENKNTLIKVFPNPFMNTVQVELGSDITGKYTLRLLSVTGNVLVMKDGEKSKVSKTETLNTSALTYGIYFLEIISDNKRSVHKLKKILSTPY